MDYQQIMSSLKNNELHPLYFLCGEEPFYIDDISNYIAKNGLTESEKEFNQTIIYATIDSKIEDVIIEAKQFPFGADRRIVIVREAQNIRNFDALENYILNPQTTTTLVFCYKGKSLDKRKKITKNLIQNHIYFHSKKIYDNKLTQWINQFVLSKGMKISFESASILSAHIGNNLSKIKNAVDKLSILIDNNNKEITSELVEKHIGVSKQYNIFELQNSLGKKDKQNSLKIMRYMTVNTKENPLPKIVGGLFSYFHKIITYKSIKNKSEAAKKLSVNPFFLKEYERAANNYTVNQLFYIFNLLRIYDVRSKGVNNKNTNHSELLKELILKILSS